MGTPCINKVIVSYRILRWGGMELSNSQKGLHPVLVFDFTKIRAQAIALQKKIHV